MISVGLGLGFSYTLIDFLKFKKGLREDPHYSGSLKPGSLKNVDKKTRCISGVPAYLIYLSNKKRNTDVACLPQLKNQPPQLLKV